MGSAPRRISRNSGRRSAGSSRSICCRRWRSVHPRSCRTGLARLVDAGLIFQRGTPPHATYLFKHALIQDAAYSTLLREPRQRLHARIAEALQEQSSETALEHPEVLAQHYAKAGLAERAAACWQLAGERAVFSFGERGSYCTFLRGSQQLPNWPKGARSKSWSWTSG